MLSLNKVNTDDGVRAFVVRFVGLEMDYWVKFDGVSMPASYEKGQLVRCATRGNGEIGEDVTDNALGIGNLPDELVETIDCEIRVEVVMFRSDFALHNETYFDASLANPRNAAV